MKSLVIAFLCLLVVGSFNTLFAVDEQRQAYDRMVEESTREADEYMQERRNRTQAAETEPQAQQNSVIEEKVQAERQRIETEMGTVQGRGLGPTFTQGMKDNLLQQLQDRLDRLASDPEAYFAGQ